MGERLDKQPISLGLLAHVDAGKTTLSEALLFRSGARRTLGRVDHGDAYLDTHSLERQRGITIFSKQARMATENLDITLVDTPGHVDFSAEAERTMPILNCAVLVISGTDGIQAHTVTLWRLLERYEVPTFLFINKMDLPGMEKEKLLQQLQRELSPGCIDFGMEQDELQEAVAMCDEALLETYLETGEVTPGNIRGLIAGRKVFPCCFGSALKLEGVDQLIDIINAYAPEKTYPDEFGAKVYKISRDPQGNRLTWMKITGGSLKVRENMRYVNQKGDEVEEKAVQLRLYSADKFAAPEEVTAGMLAAVTGLSGTFAGQGLGAEPAGVPPVLEPVMTYRVELPKNVDPATVLPKLRQLEEEDPQLHIIWDQGRIHVQIMGRVQLEIFRSLVQQRFGLDITLDKGRIFYKETIASTVEGVGHYEPLRHYAEVHLLLEPLPPGSGIVKDSACSTDVLDIAYQSLIMAHIGEKVHRGVLTGAPLTDVKITLLVGKAHLKHTEGGDMRQATYRAIRQGLMQAKSVLLEPWYSFTLTLPTETIGRAITDIRAMGGEFDSPESTGSLSVLKGLIPASELGDYADTVASYTQGRGRLQIALNGYAPCHNPEEVIAEAAYDPEADLPNTPDSVFCAHGAGFNVKWHEVKNYMHLESGLKEEKPAEIITRNFHIDDKELEAIMEREFGPVKRPLYRAPANRPATEEITIRAPKQKCLIVDGYNIIFAWDDLAALAKEDLEAARRKLCDILSNYAGFKKCYLVLVFDGWKVKGNPGEKTQYHNIKVVYTKEGETGDAYIESLVAQIGSNYAVRVASSDNLVQLSSFRTGVLRVSARELREEIDLANKEMKQHFNTKRGMK
ncbi:MAG: TetM/TetW/TetO/TetS family tetracycline resistance ribosomal protection protein [Oscillospiraceae bacterium]|nr:TetM/TetW/TetO/TetS family tetracycline resistance ribosomal protection protein [Oscillospiraceae bacterium]